MDIKTNQEAEKLILTLPLPPSLNDYYGHRAVTDGYMVKYVKHRGKTFQKQVNEYVELNNFNIQANVPLKVTVVLNFQSKRRTDLDNRMKPLLDSLTEAQVWEDDSLIDELHIYRGFIQKPGSCIVTIEEFLQD